MTFSGWTMTFSGWTMTFSGWTMTFSGWTPSLLWPFQGEKKGEKTDLKFSYKEKKDARKVIGVYFFITLNLKNYEPPEPEKTDSLNLDLYLKLQKYFCLSPEQAKEAIKLRPEAELQENLACAEKNTSKARWRASGLIPGRLSWKT